MTDSRERTSGAALLWGRAWDRPRGRWPWARWGLTLLLPIAGILWLVSSIFAPGGPDVTRVIVQSQATGARIEGATVTIGDVPYVTDPDGEIVVPPVARDTPVRVSAAGHESTQRPAGGEGDMVISLNAVLVLGSLTDIVSGEPIAGADIAILDTNGDEVATSRTDRSGTFVFKFIPEDAEISVRDDVYGAHRHVIGSRRSLMIQLAPPDVRGRAVDPAGNPVPGARITGPQIAESADEDGRFLLQDVGQGTELTIEAADGHASIEVRGADLGDIELPAVLATPEASPVNAEGP